MNSIPAEKKNKIAHLYHLIEFEIDKTQSAIYAIKKDISGVILLFAALAGLIIFLPLDLLLYNWTICGIFFVMGFSLLFVFISYNLISEENDRINGEKNILSRSPSAELYQKVESFFKDTASLEFISVINAYFVILVCYFTSLLITYLLSIYSNKNLDPLYPFSPFFGFVFLIQIILFYCSFYNFSELRKKSKNRQNISFLKFSWPAIIIVILSVMLFVFGDLLNIPPLSVIVQNSSYSLKIVQSNQMYNWPLIITPIFVYFFLIFLIAIDFLISRELLDKFNNKIKELNSLKSKIDLYYFGISKNLDVHDIMKNYLIQKQISQKITCFFGLFWITLPFSSISEEESQQLFKLLLPDEDFQ